MGERAEDIEDPPTADLVGRIGKGGEHLGLRLVETLHVERLDARGRQSHYRTGLKSRKAR